MFKQEVEMVAHALMVMKTFVLMGDSTNDTSDVETATFPGMLALAATTKGQWLQDRPDKTAGTEEVGDGRGRNFHLKLADMNGDLKKKPMEETASKDTRLAVTVGAREATRGGAGWCRSRRPPATPTRTTPSSKTERGKSSCRPCAGKLTD